MNKDNEQREISRELKFRVWNPVYGMAEPATLRQMTTFEQPGNGIRVSEQRYPDDSVFMQFTGLLDKNGKEIYEGDILRWTSSNPFSLGEVRDVSVTYTQAQYWCNGYNGHRFGVYLAELLANEKCEVIGNIYSSEPIVK